jgi:hypothetical protein
VSAPRGRLGLACGLLLVVALLLIAALASSAPAQRSTVVLVVPELPDADLAEAYVRMHGELRAAGFEVKRAASRQELEPARALAVAAEELAPAAVIGIFDNPSGALEFWILDVHSGRTSLKRLARGGDPARAPEILAISAVELLLAGLSELDIKPAPETSAAPPSSSPAASRTKTTGDAKPSRPERRAAALRWGIELGMAAAASADRAGVAWLPAARLQWAPLPVLRARVSGLGLGTHPQVAGPGGVARTSQAMLLTEVVVRPWELSGLAPQVSLGSGAYYFQIEGRSTQSSSLGATASQWSAAVDAGLGLSWRLHRHLELVFEAHALFAQPYPSIRFAGAEQASAGRPTLVFSATVAGWL